MKIKIVTAMSYNQSEPFTIRRLLGGFNTSIMPQKYRTIFNYPIEIFDKYEDDFVVDIVGSSRDNITEMHQNILNIKVSASRPIVVVRSIKNGPKGKEESFDVVLILYNPITVNVQCIFLLKKSLEKKKLTFKIDP